jgi:hypothetical protein
MLTLSDAQLKRLLDAENEPEAFWDNSKWKPCYDLNMHTELASEVIVHTFITEMSWTCKFKSYDLKLIRRAQHYDMPYAGRVVTDTFVISRSEIIVLVLSDLPVITEKISFLVNLDTIAVQDKQLQYTEKLLEYLNNV